MLVGVIDNKSDGASRRLAFKDTTEELHLVSFIPPGCDVALSGAAAIKLMLDKLHVNVYAGRHSINDTADGLSMTLAE
jgi:hypothetical protein